MTSPEITWNITGASVPAEGCYHGGKYSLECLQATVCPQFNHYFISTGMVIIIAYIALSWLLWWYMNHGYKAFPLPIDKFWGDVNKLETRIYWDTWVRARISKVMLVFIAIVVWLSWNRNV